MSTTVMSVKTDRDIKEKAQILAKSLGFPLSTLINAFLRQFVREETVYFSTEPAYRMSKALERDLKGVEGDLKKGKNLSPAFKNSKEMVNFLKKM